MSDDFVRCVNPKTNQWGMFRKSIANDKSWQANSGFYPEPAPVTTTSGTDFVMEIPTGDYQYSPAPEHIQPAPVKARGRKAKTN